MYEVRIIFLMKIKDNGPFLNLAFNYSLFLIESIRPVVGV